LNPSASFSAASSFLLFEQHPIYLQLSPR